MAYYPNVGLYDLADAVQEVTDRGREEDRRIGAVVSVVVNHHGGEGSLVDRKQAINSRCDALMDTVEKRPPPREKAGLGPTGSLMRRRPFPSSWHRATTSPSRRTGEYAVSRIPGYPVIRLAAPLPCPRPALPRRRRGPARPGRTRHNAAGSR